MATSIETLEMEINALDTRIEALHEKIEDHERRLKELRAGHRLIENTAADTLAQLKKEGRI